MSGKIGVGWLSLRLLVAIALVGASLVVAALAVTLWLETSPNPWYPLSGRLAGTWVLASDGAAPVSADGLTIRLETAVEPVLDGGGPPDAFSLAPRVYWRGSLSWRGTTVPIQVDTNEPGIWLRCDGPSESCASLLGESGALSVWMSSSRYRPLDQLYVGHGPEELDGWYVRSEAAR